MEKFNVTYEIVTPESAEYGEAEECGFIAEDVDLREAFCLVGHMAIEADSWPTSLDNPPRWLTNYEFNENYTTGARESRSLHLPDTITGSSAMRIARLLGVKQL